MLKFEAIGLLSTPFFDAKNMPIQPFSDQSRDGYVDILPEFVEGLDGLELFSHVILIYHFHQQTQSRLTVKPFLDKVKHGVFATRAPSRPNHIGISIVPLLKIEGSRIFLKNLDMLDGTPLLDIKPYVPDFDYYPKANSGWLKKTEGNSQVKSDDRFVRS